eukprot:6766540-Prymnesium_polylepis.1
MRRRCTARCLQAQEDKARSNCAAANGKSFGTLRDDFGAPSSAAAAPSGTGACAASVALARPSRPLGWLPARHMPRPALRLTAQVQMWARVLPSSKARARRPAELCVRPGPRLGRPPSFGQLDRAKAREEHAGLSR